MKRQIFVILVFLVIYEQVKSQEASSSINPSLLKAHWSSYWIAPSDVSLKTYGVYHFRKRFDLSSVPQEFIIHTSADNRYKLFINGEYVVNGPARGDLFNWRFETTDIAPYLKPGENVIAAVVWNYGKYIPWAQISDRTGFVVQGNTAQEAIVNTNDSWKVIENQAYSPIGVLGLNTFIVVGPGDRIDAKQYPWGWQQLNFNDTNWETPLLLNNAAPPGVGTDLFWMMVPRTIPAMEMQKQNLQKARRSVNLTVDQSFIEGKSSLKIPANTQATILFDQGALTTAYPTVMTSQGEDALIKMIYAEALFNENNRKGNRNEIEGKTIKGNEDIFILDGGENRTFTTLWFRTFRYLQLEIETKDQPLTIESMYSLYTAYPFEENGRFASDDESLQNIWDVGWRTARLCAGETYFDCPYYEQLQYVGDTRIQALISLYVSGDDLLMRKAIELFDNSRLPMGLTQSRYPTSSPQIIPPYSLFWISMIHDHWMHRDNPEFVKSYLFGIQGVLQWYENHLGDDGLLGPMPWWNFVDWAEEWPWVTEKRIGGVPAGGSWTDGGSSIISLQLVYNINYAVELFRAFDRPTVATHYEKIAERIKEAIKEKCWDESKGFYADTPKKENFSQHANIMAILVDLIPEDSETEFMQKVLQDTSLIQTTFYYKYYLVRAMKKAGLADQYLEILKPWHQMLDKGLTTFAEKPDPTRSDCHAWSSSPNYDFLATVCGIEPAVHGFKKVTIEPALGPLNWIQGSVPHPKGTIQIDLKRKGKEAISGEVILPNGISGTFLWNGKKINLKEGSQIIDL